MLQRNRAVLSCCHHGISWLSLSLLTLVGKSHANDAASSKPADLGIQHTEKIFVCEHTQQIGKWWANSRRHI